MRDTSESRVTSALRRLAAANEPQVPGTGIQPRHYILLCRYRNRSVAAKLLQRLQENGIRAKTKTTRVYVSFFVMFENHEKAVNILDDFAESHVDTKSSRSDQFSIAGLLFVTLGVALFAAVVPHLYAMSWMNPPWSFFVLSVLMFSWCVIPLRIAAERAWWIGFLVSGSLFLAIAVLLRLDERVAQLGYDELTLVLGTVFTSLVVLLGAGIVGGVVFRMTYEHCRFSAGNPHGEAKTEPADAPESPFPS
jgi:hypothetical protein